MYVFHFFPGYFLTPCDVKVSLSLCKTPTPEVLQECAEVACDSIFDTKARSMFFIGFGMLPQHSWLENGLDVFPIENGDIP